MTDSDTTARVSPAKTSDIALFIADHPRFGPALLHCRVCKYTDTELHCNAKLRGKYVYNSMRLVVVSTRNQVWSAANDGR